jgi:hypothetical protein
LRQYGVNRLAARLPEIIDPLVKIWLGWILWIPLAIVIIPAALGTLSAEAFCPRLVER